MTYRIKSKHPGGYIETATGVADPERFVAEAIKNFYTILLITQERGMK